MNVHSHLRSVLASLALLSTSVGCGQSVRPEWPSDGGDGQDGAPSASPPSSASLDGSGATSLPVCPDGRAWTAMLFQPCTTPGAVLCTDPCQQLICRTPFDWDGGLVDGGVALRWEQRLACNGPLPPPALGC